MKSFVILSTFSFLVAFTIGHPQRTIDEEPETDGVLSILLLMQTLIATIIPFSITI